MTIRLGVIMDPISQIHYQKDSTLAMLWAAQARGWELYYLEQHDLFLRDGVPQGHAKKLRVFQDPAQWFMFDAEAPLALAELDVILMRKDPPFDETYLYITYILEQAERLGVLVVNRPQGLRDANEKFFATYFPGCIPPTLVTSSITQLRAFWQEHKDIVCKPLHGMGGVSVFRLKHDDVNANEIFATLTQHGSRFIIAQTFIPEIVKGDKRILFINGEPIPHALARVPHGHDWRGNLAKGAKGIVQPLSERDRVICAQLSPVLRERGLYFVGIDVIGDYLTEVNVTSPTGIREIEAETGLNAATMLMEWVEHTLA